MKKICEVFLFAVQWGKITNFWIVGMKKMMSKDTKFKSGRQKLNLVIMRRKTYMCNIDVSQKGFQAITHTSTIKHRKNVIAQKSIGQMRFITTSTIKESFSLAAGVSMRIFSFIVSEIKHLRRKISQNSFGPWRESFQILVLLYAMIWKLHSRWCLAKIKRFKAP